MPTPTKLLLDHGWTPDEESGWSHPGLAHSWPQGYAVRLTREALSRELDLTAPLVAVELRMWGGECRDANRDARSTEDG